MTVYKGYSGALKRLAHLIDTELKPKIEQEVIDEIKAWNRLLKKHIKEQDKAFK